MAIIEARNVSTGCICDNDITAQIPLIAVNGGLFSFIKYKLKFVHFLEYLHLQFQTIQDVQQ